MIDDKKVFSLSNLDCLYLNIRRFWLWLEISLLDRLKMKIRLYENLRACSYTPFYLAQMENMFSDEGLDVSLILSPSTSETAQGLIDGRADVSFGGPMRVLLHHNQAKLSKTTSELVCFAQVVARDPFILLGRKPNDNFVFNDLLDHKLAVAVDVPTPWMTLQDDLSRANIDPNSILRYPDATMPENVDLFKDGKIDLVQLFEPFAQELKEAGAHVWHRFASRGDIAFTTFYALKSFTVNQRETCKALVRVINRALNTINYMSSVEIAKIIGPSFFPELSSNSLASIIEGYKASKVWPTKTDLPASAFVKLKAALLSGNLIQFDIPYDEVIDENLSKAD